MCVCVCVRARVGKVQRMYNVTADGTCKECPKQNFIRPNELKFLTWK
jgi:hypothetical protein